MCKRQQNEARDNLNATRQFLFWLPLKYISIQRKTENWDWNFNVSLRHMWHPLVSEDQGSVSKDLCFICWRQHWLYYGCTCPHESDSLDCNDCIWRRFSSMSPWFLSIEHSSLRRKALVSSFFAPSLALNHVSSVAERWWRFPTSL